MAMQHDKQFKLDAIRYYQDHKDLGVRGCAENLGIGYSTLTKWLKDFRESGDILATTRGASCQSLTGTAADGIIAPERRWLDGTANTAPAAPSVGGIGRRGAL